jgi:hypothetical protein
LSTGANFVQDEFGQMINLEALSDDQRVALSKMLLTCTSWTHTNLFALTIDDEQSKF